MNKKIKIIEILNAISNGEKVPLEIKFRNIIYIFNKECNQYYEKGKGSYFNNKLKFDKTIEWNFYGDFLNEEVEILEDNTEEIEEIKQNWVSMDELTAREFTSVENILKDKINELVRRINYIERKINEN